MKNLQSKRLGPFVYFSCSANSTLLAFLFFFLIQFFLLFVGKNFASIYIILYSVLGTLLAEILANFLLNEKFFGISSIVQGMTIGFLLPATYSPIATVFLTFFCMLFFRYAFGGYAQTWINTVALTVAIAWILDVTLFPEFLISKENLFATNPSLKLIQAGSVPVFPFDTKVTELLNKKVFSFLGISIPDGYVSFLLDNQSIIPAFRFNLLTLLFAAIFFAFDFVSILIPTCYILVYCTFVYFLSPAVFSDISSSGDIILALFSSGTIFCSIFLLPWFGTVPSSLWGKMIYGIFAGVTAFFIIGCGTSPIGSVFTVILSNFFSLFIQEVEDYVVKRRLNHLLKKEISVVMEVSK